MNWTEADYERYKRGKGRKVRKNIVKKKKANSKTNSAAKVEYVIHDIPPSNNKYMGRGSKGLIMQYQIEKKRWARDIFIIIGKNKPDRPYEKAIVTLKYLFQTRRKRDPDNYSGKWILDALTECGVIADDSFNTIELRIRGGYDKENPRTIVTVEKTDKIQ